MIERHGYRALAAIVALAVLASPYAAVAGSKFDPEITDPAEDLQIVGPTLVNVAVPEIDILKVWFESDAQAVRAYIHVSDAAHTSIEDSDVSYRIAYSDAHYELGDLTADSRGDQWRFYWSGTEAGSSSAESAWIEGGVSENTIWMSLPRELVHEVIAEPRASSILLWDGPAGVGHGGPVWLRDWAPDAGAGRSFELT